MESAGLSKNQSLKWAPPVAHWQDRRHTSEPAACDLCLTACLKSGQRSTNLINCVRGFTAVCMNRAQANVGLAVDPSAPLFSFIGRLEEQKGADILLEAIPRLMAQVPNAQVRTDAAFCYAAVEMKAVLFFGGGEDLTEKREEAWRKCVMRQKRQMCWPLATVLARQAFKPWAVLSAGDCAGNGQGQPGAPGPVAGQTGEWPGQGGNKVQGRCMCACLDHSCVCACQPGLQEHLIQAGRGCLAGGFVYRMPKTWALEICRELVLCTGIVPCCKVPVAVRCCCVLHSAHCIMLFFGRVPVAVICCCMLHSEQCPLLLFGMVPVAAGRGPVLSTLGPPADCGLRLHPGAVPL